MSLWDVIPSRFFSLLASQNREIYAEALLLLYEQYLNNQFGIPYGYLRDIYQELLESKADVGELLAAEADETPVDTDLVGPELARAQAAAMIRRLKAYGWIDLEVRASFEQYIIVPFYSSRILTVLQELCQQRTVEYQRYAFDTYQLLAGDAAKEQPCSAILSARDTTQRFMESMRELANNMKQYMQDVVSKTTVQEVLEHHLDFYQSSVIDSSYHRLKTSDHVSRYRQAILDTVQQYLLSDDLFSRAVHDGLSSHIFTDQEQARDGLLTALRTVESAYRNLDAMLHEIDLRHNQYLRASFDRARYLGQFSHGFDQMLAHVLNWVASDSSAVIPNEAFRLQSLALLNEHSLYSPRQRRQPHRPTEHRVLPVPPELRELQRQENLERLRKVITREKVQRYVLDRLGERRSMSVEELAPEDIEQFLYLAAVYLYGYDGQAGYRLERGEKSVTLQVGPYIFDQRTIVRLDEKGGKRRV
jgi:hypothetical protein